MSGVVTFVASGGTSVDVIPRDEIRRIRVDYEHGTQTLRIWTSRELEHTFEHIDNWVQQMVKDLRVNNADTDVTWTNSASYYAYPQWTRTEGR